MPPSFFILICNKTKMAALQSSARRHVVTAVTESCIVACFVTDVYSYNILVVKTVWKREERRLVDISNRVWLYRDSCRTWLPCRPYFSIFPHFLFFSFFPSGILFCRHYLFCSVAVALQTFCQRGNLLRWKNIMYFGIILHVLFVPYFSL